MTSTSHLAPGWRARWAARLKGAHGNRHIPLPPPDLLLTVGSPTADDFVLIGDRWVQRFKTLVDLQPTAHVLDVGCGCGRIARPLTTFLDRDGAYDGVDVKGSHVAWCAKEITARYPNFRFWHADIANSRYNPSGRIRSVDYVYPFDSGSLDFVFLTSVFTHMLPYDVAHYISEISRVLRPGGRAVVTYFLLNDSSRAAIASKRGRFEFRQGSDQPCWVASSSVPEQAVAHHQETIVQLHADHGLRIDQIHRGSWTGTEAETFQDVIVVTRTSDPASRIS